MQARAEHFIGVIADTHGLLRPEATAALAGCEQIIHAGDVDRPEILAQLGEIAPVTAVRGNVDFGVWASQLHYTEVVVVGGLHLYVLHDIGQLSLDPAAAGFAAVIYGHSHRPEIKRKGGVLYLNPGSAGRRRFNLPVSLAHLWVRDGELEAKIVDLDV